MRGIIKKRMMSPGPTEVPIEALLAGARPQIHHRTSEFREIYLKVAELAGKVFKTERPVLAIASSGTGAMEAAVSNLVSPGERPIVVAGGKFGERWARIAEAFHLDPIVIEVKWGGSVEPGAVEEALSRNPSAPAVFVQLVETSTGALHPVEELQGIVSGTDAVLVVDAISGLGAERCETDGWGLDLVLTGAQKSLMIPPGLAFISLSEKARSKVEACRMPRFYFDLRKSLAGIGKGDHPFTPPTSLLRAALAALEILDSEGIDSTVSRHARLASATRAAVRALGLEIFARRPGNVLTPVVTPKGIDGDALTRRIRDDYGVTIAGAQEPHKGEFFRLGHLGYVDDNDVIMMVGALERVLVAMGLDIPVGAGLEAAQKALITARSGKA